MKTLSIFLLCVFASLRLNAADRASFYDPRPDSPLVIRHASLVCASWFYPTGTRLRVTEIHNGSSVVVTVIECGPARRLVRQGRVIDLSRTAFLKLDGTDLGLADVKIEMIP